MAKRDKIIYLLVVWMVILTVLCGVMLLLIIGNTKAIGNLGTMLINEIQTIYDKIS